MSKTPKRANNPVWDDVIADLGSLADTVRSGGVTAAAKKFRVSRVKLSAVRDLTAADVKKAREGVGASQLVFAAFLGVSSATVRAWEQGTKQPVGAARRLLLDILTHPAHWRDRLAEAVTPA